MTTNSDQNAAAPAEDPRATKRLARSAARLAAVQALYQMEITGAPWKGVLEEFVAHRLGAEIEGAQYRDADEKHFKLVLEGAVARQIEIDQLIDAALVAKWPLGNVDPTLRAIFRAGGCEFVALEQMPPKVAISEYVDVAKAFFPEGQEWRFANAVLDHMARKARPDAFGEAET
ncbi:MAG: transcription antitermination factor NusB [Neomegalonema sp.]|nr:transcription antitermination factor NusB [Neomegalonema sp.]